MEPKADAEGFAAPNAGVEADFAPNVNDGADDPEFCPKENPPAAVAGGLVPNGVAVAPVPGEPAPKANTDDPEGAPNAGADDVAVAPNAGPVDVDAPKGVACVVAAPPAPKENPAAVVVVVAPNWKG